MPALTPRGRLVRDAIIYTPPFIFFLVLLLLMVAGVIGRAIVGIILLAGLTFLFGYQSIQSIRDLLSQPRDLVGEVRRRWTKRDGLIVKNYYIAIERTIFHIAVDEYMQIKVGDTVRVRAFPHTGTVVAIEKLKDATPAEQPAQAIVAPKATGRARTLRTARATPRERRDVRPERDDGEV